MIQTINLHGLKVDEVFLDRFRVLLGNTFPEGVVLHEGDCSGVVRMSLDEDQLPLDHLLVFNFPTKNAVMTVNRKDDASA